MNDYGIILLNLILVSVTGWTLKRFLNIVFEKKKKNLFTIMIGVLFLLFQVLVEYNRGNASSGTIIINIVLVLVISVSGYQKAGVKKAFYVVLYFVVCALIEMLVFFCMMIVPISRAESDIIGSVISKLITIIAVNILAINWKKQYSAGIPLSYFLALLVVACGSIYIACEEFFSIEYNVNNFTSMITFCILLLINVIIFEIITKLSERFMIEKEKIVYAQQVQIMARSTEEQKKTMEEFYEEKHNLINQLIVLKDSVENCERENVIKKLNNLIQSFSINENISNSGNNVVDAIINFKYSIAKEKEIQIHLKIFIPAILPLNQYELGIILGNAIDNAIEATMNCKFHEKIINIYMGIKKESLVLVIRNPYEHILLKDKSDNLLSTKGKSSRHGYGVNSLKRVVEEYQGEVIVEMEKEYFSLTIIMNIMEI